jgi:hypothetical protein
VRPGKTGRQKATSSNGKQHRPDAQPKNLLYSRPSHSAQQHPIHQRACHVPALKQARQNVKTTTIGTLERGTFDSQIMANLLITTVDLETIKKEEKLIAIRNEDGEIYRIIGTTGANKYTNAIEELIDLGLEDELEGKQPKDGFQAIFRAV